MSGNDAVIIAIGKIRLDVPKLAELKATVKSPVVSIANMPWSLEVTSGCSKRTSDIKQFSVFVRCNDDNKSPHWSCEASTISSLLSSKVGQKSHSDGPLVYTFCAKKKSRGYPRFIAWDQVRDPENGFIREEDIGVTVEATITITKVIGLLVPTLYDFTAPQPDLTDVALIVEEKPIHVNKAYLAFHSSVFQSMFFSDFAEKSKKEIPLPDVRYDEFVELLHAIFPSRKPVAVATVEGLLRLGDRFNMQMVLHSCEEFLRGQDSKEIPLVKKLLWSDQYRLASLKYICFDVRVLKGMKEYGDFSNDIKAALLERILELG